MALPAARRLRGQASPLNPRASLGRGSTSPGGEGVSSPLEAVAGTRPQTQVDRCFQCTGEVLGKGRGALHAHPVACHPKARVPAATTVSSPGPGLAARLTKDLQAPKGPVGRTRTGEREGHPAEATLAWVMQRLLSREAGEWSIRASAQVQAHSLCPSAEWPWENGFPSLDFPLRAVGLKVVLISQARGLHRCASRRA